MASNESLEKLHKILIKITGKEFTEEELEMAYNSLIRFATSLMELGDKKN